MGERYGRLAVRPSSPRHNRLSPNSVGPIEAPATKRIAAVCGGCRPIEAPAAKRAIAVCGGRSPIKAPAARLDIAVCRGCLVGILRVA